MTLKGVKLAAKDGCTSLPPSPLSPPPPTPPLLQMEKPVTLNVSVFRECNPATKKSLTITFMRSSSQAAWEPFLDKASRYLAVERVEGIYTEVGLFPVHTIASLKEGASYAVRPTEDCALLRSLTGVSDDEYSWSIVEAGKVAKFDLDKEIAEWKKEHGDMDLLGEAPTLDNDGENDNFDRQIESLVDLGPLDLDSYSSTKQDRKFTDVDDPDWYSKFGEGGLPLKYSQVSTVNVIDNDGTIKGDALNPLRDSHGTKELNAKEICDQMKREMKRVREINRNKAKENRLAEPKTAQNHKSLTKVEQEALVSDQYKEAKPPDGKTLGIGGSHEIGLEAGWSSVASYGLRSLATMTKNSTVAREETFSCLGHELIIKAMHAHKLHRWSGVYGCAAIANLCTKGTQATLANAGAVECILEQMELHPIDQRVTANGIMALFNLSWGGLNFICDAIARKNGILMACDGVKRFPDNVEICTYTVWMLKELIRGGMIENVRDDEGIFAASMVYGRYYNNEPLKDSALEVEEKLLEGLEFSPLNQKLLRDKNQGRACGGGSSDDVKVLQILREYPLYTNLRQQERLQREAEEAEERKTNETEKEE